MIQQDQLKVAKLEKNFHEEEGRDPELKERHERGRLFEAIVNYGIDHYGWTGENSTVVIPSRYDDYENNIDSVIVFKIQMGRSTLALTMDITKSRKELLEKFEDVRQSIQQDTLTEIKYFKYGEFSGSEKRVPRVIVGAGQFEMSEVADLLVRTKKMAAMGVSPESETFKDVQQQLRNHPLQFKILDEMQKQLAVFRQYASENGKQKVAERYGEAEEIISHIIAKKGGSAEALAKRNKRVEDSIYQSILEETQRFSR